MIKTKRSSQELDNSKVYVNETSTAEFTVSSRVEKIIIHIEPELSDGPVLQKAYTR